MLCTNYGKLSPNYINRLELDQNFFNKIDYLKAHLNHIPKL